MNIQFSVCIGDDARESPEQHPRNILLVANFSGIEASGGAAASDDPIRVMFSMDALDVDAALERLRPHLSLLVGDDRLDLKFSSMDDFHPDQLLASQPIFKIIFELKQSLADPAKADAAALVCREMLGREYLAGSEAAPVAAPEAPQPARESSGDVLSRLLGQATHRADSGNVAVHDTVQRLLEDAAGADVIPDSAPEIQSLQDGLERLGASALRELLRTPGFRNLELAWRSVQWLQEQLEFAAGMSLWLVDIGDATVENWAPMLQSRVNQTAGSADLLVVLEQFSDSPDSLRQLGSLASAARAMGTRAFAAAAPSLAGRRNRSESITALDASDIDDNESDDWLALRADGAAASVGLGFPRLLLRQPYGKRSDPIDAFEFEELESAPQHDAFFWGNPAIALTVMSLQQHLQVDDLPMVTYDDGSGQAIKPPTEVYLTDSAAEKLLQRGLIPLTGQRGHTSVRIPRLQSVAKDPTAL